jgi:type II secretory pathway pseudopilin PulG
MLAFPSTRGVVFVLVAVVLLAMASLSFFCGRGLWKLRSYGRAIQLVFSWIGLLALPIGTIIHLLILLYLYRPGIKVLFSGRSAEQLTAVEVTQLQKVASMGGIVIAIAVVVLGFGGVAMTGIVAAIAIPNFLNAVDRGKQKRTTADIRRISQAVESYAVDNDFYPVAGDLEELEAVLEPGYIEELPRTDGWGRGLVFEPRGGEGYRLRSYGKDGRPDAGGASSTFDTDIEAGTSP